MRNLVLASLDYVFLLRPVILIPGWVFMLLGYYSGRFWTGDPAPRWYPGGTLLLSLVIGTAVMGAMYVLNQICDRETDRLNRKLYLISEGRVPVGAAVAELIVLNAAALFLAWRFFAPAYGVLVTASIVGGVAYSVRPVRLKGRAGWDIAANAAGFGGVAYVLGWITGSPCHPVALLGVLPYMMAVGAIHTNATVLDIEGDKAGGDATIAVRLGIRRTLWLGIALTAGALISALALSEMLTAVWAAGSLIAFGWALWKGDPGKVATANQLSGRVFVVLQGLRFPHFLVWLVIVYLGTKWYYNARFGIDYPSMKDSRDEIQAARA
ncbi:MAG: UbiA family prenyltransferase [Candidatus Eisenbacteria sp.]|nr:UbiA family prenyltransferase [Candidatus Eisenbacteria bacterium]